MAGLRSTARHRLRMQALISAIFLCLVLILLGCARASQPQDQNEQLSAEEAGSNPQNGTPAAGRSTANDRAASNGEDAAPTAVGHVVLLGETLSTIAEQYSVDINSLMARNNIDDGSRLLPGQVLLIPNRGQSEDDLPAPQQIAEYEIISDHELVYGPDARDFNVADFLQSYDGYITIVEEEVEGQTLTGAEIVQLVADRHSVNPRLLLAVIEHVAGWLTQTEPSDVDFMLGREQEGLEGLYKQLSWAANLLNWGFYGRADGGAEIFLVGDSQISFAPEISNGTAGVQNYLGSRDNITYSRWLVDVGPDGFAATYRRLFGGSPAVENSPLLPQDLQQPALLLPWASGETWYYTGGPHGGWNSGSAWAALDFVPSDVEYGCVPSSSWVTAVADGVVARSGFGAVVLDLDGDGYAGSGWAITYMHLDNNDRIAAGSAVSAGDRIGHPGCEGGVTNGTHVHLARTYNGRWISADGNIPFNLSGWISSGEGYEYNGWLQRDDEIKTADIYKSEDNAITAE